MSDKRATYVIGTVAISLALVLGLVVAIPATSTVSMSSSPLAMMGHAEVVLKDTDGTIKAYQQTDNVVVTHGQDCSADALFGVITAADMCDNGVAEWLFIGVGSSINKLENII